jgi:hypothetical protein
MKAPDITQSPMFKRYGVRGLKLFAKIWFPVLYLMLIAVTAGFLIVGQEFAGGWRRIFLSCFVGTLIVFASSLLTRMRLKFLAEIEQLESQGKTA